MPPVAARFHGSHALPELGLEIAESGVEVVGYMQEYFRASGLSPTSGLGKELAVHFWTLHAAYCIDKLNGTSLASCEHSARRILQIQKAVARSPRAPDFETLDGIMKHSSRIGGAAHTPAFDKDVSEHQRQEGLMMKNARLAREETSQETERVKNPNPKAKTKAKAKNKGRGAGDDEDE